MWTRRFLHCLAALAMLQLSSMSAMAQEWPAQPVTIVVPYAPGGAVDIMARALAEKLTTRWKQPVLVDNRTGAAEVIAANSVARARPDGYTLFLATEVGLETNPWLFSKLSYNPITDFTHITRVIEGPLVYVVKADYPARTIQQLIQQAKEQPGKIAYGSSGAGGAVHIAVNWFGIVSGNTQFNHVPYRGSAPAVLDVLAGNVQFTAAPLSLVAPYIKANQMRAIATTGTARIRSLPDVPTLAELGYRDSAITFMFGLVGPAKMSAPLAERIAADVASVVREPEFAARNVEANGFVLALESPAEFSRYLVANQEKQKARVKAANVQLD